MAWIGNRTPVGREFHREMCAAHDPIADLRAELVRLHDEVGKPTYRQLEAHGARLGLSLATSTVSDLLTGRRRARWNTVWWFVQACREHAHAAGPDVPAVRFDEDWWKGQYDQQDAAEPAGTVGRVVRRGYYTSVIDAFRADHAEADWGDTVDKLLTAFTAAPGFHVVTGEAYAGKTALMTKLHKELERRGVPVVIFYVVQHEADRPIHYLPAVIAQLLAVLASREDVYASFVLEPTPERQLVQYEELWCDFVAGPEPVFLLLDGLDERALELGGAGLAGLVPRSAGTHGRVVLTTRPNPALGLPRAHPLTRRLTTATRVLTPSPRARAQRDLVEREVAAFLRGEDPRGRDLAGLIAVAGAPVSDREVAELLDLPGPGVAAALREPIARSLFLEPAPDTTPRFRFAHQQIRAFVEEELDRDGAGETDAAIARVLEWADRYAAGAWPSRTPHFLREHLPTFIASRVAPGRRARQLTALLDDDYRRLKRMVSGNDRTFFQLLDLARDMVVADADFGYDPGAAFMVETWSANMVVLTQIDLYTSCTTLARAGLHDNALDGARLIPSPVRRCTALDALVTVLHEQGAVEALRSAHQVMAATFSALQPDTIVYDIALGRLVRSALAAGDPAAVRTALNMATPDKRKFVAESSVSTIHAQIRADLAVEFSRSELSNAWAAIFLRGQTLLHHTAGAPEKDVRTLLAGIPDSARPAVDAQLRARKAVATGRSVDVCLSLFAELRPAERAFELGELALFLAGSDPDGAVVAARAAHAEVATLISREDTRYWGANNGLPDGRLPDGAAQFGVVAAGRVYAQAGLLDNSAEVARELIDDHNYIVANCYIGEIYEEIACFLTRMGRIEEARELADQDPTYRAAGLTGIARAAAETGRLPVALTIARDVDPSERDQFYGVVVDGLRRAGDHEQARQVALESAVEPATDRDFLGNGEFDGEPLCLDLIAIGRLDLARRAADRVPESVRRRLLARIDAATQNEETAANKVLTTASAVAREGNHQRCAAIARETVDPSLRRQLTAVEAFCLHRLGRLEEASTRLDTIMSESREDAAIAALLMAQAFQAEPDEPAFRACAVHLAEALLRLPASVEHRGVLVLAHSSMVLSGDIGTGLAQVTALDDGLLLPYVLRRTCRSLVAARPDHPQLSTLVDHALAHLQHDESSADSFSPDDRHFAELVKITAQAGRVAEALRLASAIVSDKLRAQALSEVLPAVVAAQRHDAMWALAGQFDNPLHQVQAASRAIATMTDPSKPTYRRSVRQLFDAVQATNDIHQRWQALGHLALALLPAAPECLDHYLPR